MSDVTRILARIESGEAQAAEQLLPLVYDELRKLAAAKLAQEKPGQTLQATALVHEAFLRLVPATSDDATASLGWNGRGHFFAAAAQAMQRILVEKARRKQCLKHGGGRSREELGEIAIADGQQDEILALDEALSRLAASDAMAAELVKLRYFAGLTIPQAAELLGISWRKANFLWAFARAWLRQEIESR